jgi:hypothetical protein
MKDVTDLESEEALETNAQESMSEKAEAAELTSTDS